MLRGLLIAGFLSVVVFVWVPNVLSSVVQLFRNNEPAEAVFVTYSTISDWSEHREMAAKLFNGELDQSPNYSSMRRDPDNPLSSTEAHRKGMVLRATSSIDGGDDGRFRFLILFLSRDPGMVPTKYVFKKGRTSGTRTTLIGGSVDLSTGLITYAYPGSGYIRVRPAGPNSIEVEYHVEYRCVTGSGTPNRWQAGPDCDQHLFPESVVYEELVAATG